MRLVIFHGPHFALTSKLVVIQATTLCVCELRGIPQVVDMNPAQESDVLWARLEYH